MSDFGRRYVREYNVLGNFVFADMHKQVVSGIFTELLEVQQKYFFYQYNSSNALNDEIEFEVFAQNGIRTLEILTVTSTMAAILSIYIDDILQGSIDLYTPAEVYNELKTLSLTVVGTKRHSLRIKVTGRNIAGSDYYMILTHLRIK